MSQNKKLTPKQELFCQEYIKDRNATQAYLRAGYNNSKSAEVSSHKLLRNPKIAHRINDLVNPHLKRLKVNREAVLQELAIIGFSSIDDFVIVDGNKLLFKNFNDIPEELKRAICQLKETKHGIEIKLHPKVSALDILAEYTKIIKHNDKDEEERPIQVNIQMGSRKFGRRE